MESVPDMEGVIIESVQVATSGILNIEIGKGGGTGGDNSIPRTRVSWRGGPVDIH